ncbi:BMP family ABC transporter substrate-binding protein [Pyramidobacter sp. YE332]|uniref:BMP family ABC transporter substrate-binding protein n=1 Tax=Pyramidobacter sp. YE332 TaxID=3068894 RepID=UPI00294AC0F0|nr:BMP family ABC transporter substrate-binding protein [Pyramidobacter sp. YE332]WOL40266.1 BMP family ABC transporter substrate-binding protein [Pyramidobacter sp. YE332]
MRFLRVLLLLAVWSVSAAPLQARRPLPIGVVFSCGPEDSMFRSSLSGIKRARSELDVKITSYLCNYNSAEYESTVAEAARRNRLVLAVGSPLAEAVDRAARAHESADFVLFDAKSVNPGVSSVLFHQSEASYLAGVLAVRLAARRNSRKIGIILGERGEKTPAMLDFLLGFEQGAKDADGRTTLLKRSVQSWNSPQKAKAIARAMHDEGAQVIFQAAGLSGNGVVEAAIEEGFYVIGVDEPQERLAPGVVLTAVLKRFDLALFDVISARVGGHLRRGATLHYRLWNRGVELSWTSNALIPDELRRELEGLSYRIVDRAIRVASCYNDDGTFKATLKPLPPEFSASGSGKK